MTGLNSGDNLAPGCPVIRSLKQERAFQGDLIGLSYDALEAGLYVDGLVNDAYLLPYPSQGLEPLKTRLVSVHAASRFDVLIPNLDSELLSFIRLAPLLSERGIRFCLPTEDQLMARAKTALPDLADRCGVRVPKTLPVFDRAAAARGIKGVGYPLVVKGVFCEAYVAYSVDQALGYFDLIAARWGLPVLLQEHVTGTEFDLAAVGDGAGGMVGGVAMLKQSLSEKGKAWSGVTVNDKALFRLADRVLDALPWKGPLEFEALKAKHNDRWYLLEINPRFPAWIYLATAAGQNLPFACFRLALGETVKPMRKYRTGVRFVRYAQDLICDQAEFNSLSSSGSITREVSIERAI